MQIITAFLTGLFSDSAGYRAGQAGLLISMLVANKKEHNSSTNQQWVITGFILARILGHSLIGGLLGLLEQSLLLDLQIRGVLQIITSIFMIAAAFNLISHNSIRPYFTSQSPGWLYNHKIIHRQKMILIG